MKSYARIDAGVVAELFATDGDIAEMFHPDLVWVEIPDGVSPEQGWSYADGQFTPPPPPSAEQLASAALAQRTSLMEWATREIAPLQDAVDLDEATADEVSRLKTLKQYRVSLSRLEQQEGWPASITWPAYPG
ncbi:tail fiber assembly protein [Pseudomonas citronellolis]|uniref:tail fiber assembly protein n=1 Tax=Pseudomonas citronellolis TaxID=53408 RepID=UPI0038998779